MKNSLEYLSEKEHDLIHMKITEILSLVTSHQAIIMVKDKQIKSLENKLKDLEQHTRKENVIISVLATDHKTYVRQCAPNDSNTNHANAPKVEFQSLEHKVAG